MVGASALNHPDWCFVQGRHSIQIESSTSSGKDSYSTDVLPDSLSNHVAEGIDSETPLTTPFTRRVASQVMRPSEKDFKLMAS